MSALPLNAAWPADPKASLSVDLDSQPLEAALVELSRQGHLQLVIATGTLPVRVSTPLHGNMPLGMALDRLLRDTGLTYKLVGDHTIAIVKSPNPAQRPSDPPASPGVSGANGPGTDSLNGGVAAGSGDNNASRGDRTVNHRSLMLRIATFLGICASTSVTGPACAQSVTATGSDATQLEEVVVTAEKRSADSQHIPVSIAVVSGEEAMRTGKQQLDQLMADVGAVKVLQGEDGPTFYIRGIGTGVPSSIGDPEINLNIDGIYQSEPQFSRAGLYDVSRVEVLRGPQGTLYGRNAVAGVVNIVTNDPTFNYGAEASIGTGNYNLVQTQGAVNLPLNDTVAVRAAFGTESHSGYLSNGADDTDVQSARVKLLWQATDKLRIVLAADTTHEGGAAEGEIQVSPPPGPPAGTPMNPPLVTTPAFPNGTYALGNVFNSSSPWTSPDPGTATRDAKFWSTRAQLDWTLDWGVFTLIPAYRQYTYSCLNCWRSETDQNNFASEKQTTVEARLGSRPDSRLTWLVGLYYLNAKNPTFGQQLGIGADSFADAPGNQINEFGQPTFNSESHAAFGQFTWPLTDRLRVTGGLRYTEDKKSEEGYTLSEVNGVTIVTTGLFGTSKSWNSTTFTAGLEGDLSADSLAYAKVSTGYKAGGFYQGAAPDSYNPEHLRSYEIGSKNRFLDRRLQVNVDAFYYDYSDYQVNYLGFINPASAGIFGILTQNAEGAKVYGADIETVWLVTPADQVDLSVYPLHARFNNLVIPGFFGGDYSGLPLPFAPNVSGKFGYQHAWKMPSSASLTARIETHLESDSWVTFQEQPGTHQPGRSVSNAYLTYEAPGAKWSFTAFVRNLENTAVLVNGQGGPVGLIAADIAPPRTYGVQLVAKF